MLCQVWLHPENEESLSSSLEVLPFTYKNLPAGTVGRKRSLRNIVVLFPGAQCAFVFVSLLPHTLCASTKSMSNICKRKTKPHSHSGPLLARVAAVHQMPTAYQATLKGRCYCHFSVEKMQAWGVSNLPRSWLVNTKTNSTLVWLQNYSLLRIPQGLLNEVESVARSL